ncbi:restriction endonuclease [Patescibacteria group bacterium]|nr:restriction endonuclease [Patescibacteria group bacterium]
MLIVKSDGSVQQYDKSKVERSILRSGIDKEKAKKILDEVELQVHDGMTTKELYRLVYDKLMEFGVRHAGRYDLQKSISRLGPAGFQFEKYIASLLRAYGYKTQNPDQDLKGSCVYHEVDVIAEKDNKTIFIEAKFRNDFNGIVRLKDTMATWARFLDLVDGSATGSCPNFDEPWIVTNGRFSDRSMQFGICKGIKLLGWKFPKEKTLASMIDDVAYYPVTAIPDLKVEELEDLSKHGLMLCVDIAKMDYLELARRVDFSEKRAEIIVSEASEICG